MKEKKTTLWFQLLVVVTSSSKESFPLLSSLLGFDFSACLCLLDPVEKLAVRRAPRHTAAQKCKRRSGAAKEQREVPTSIQSNKQHADHVQYKVSDQEQHRQRANDHGAVHFGRHLLFVGADGDDPIRVGGGRR